MNRPHTANVSLKLGWLNKVSLGICRHDLLTTVFLFLGFLLVLLLHSSYQFGLPHELCQSITRAVLKSLIVSGAILIGGFMPDGRLLDLFIPCNSRGFVKFFITAYGGR